MTILLFFTQIHILKNQNHSDCEISPVFKVLLYDWNQILYSKFSNRNSLLQILETNITTEIFFFPLASR